MLPKVQDAWLVSNTIVSNVEVRLTLFGVLGSNGADSESLKIGTAVLAPAICSKHASPALFGSPFATRMCDDQKRVARAHKFVECLKRVNGRIW